MSARRISRGVSLIEALVALAVMGFGMLGVVGMQVSMRQNSDIAKQRSEATRLAQEAIETRRAFVTMTAAPSGFLAWSDLTAPPSETINGTNAAYTRTILLPDTGSGRSKDLIVTVTWTDRAGNAQSVRLVSSVTGSTPDLATSVGIPAWGGTKVRQARGRHNAIPPAAVDQADGTSKFAPPGSPKAWVFDNSTGYIIKTCTDPSTCAAVHLRLLWGFVDFSTGTVQPTVADAAAPISPVFNLDIAVDTTAPATATVACFKDVAATYYTYYCAVPVLAIAGSTWSGKAYLTGGSLNVATAIADATTTRHRVCRYTPVRGCQPAVGSTIWGTEGTTASCSGTAPTPSRLMSNLEHPLNYLDVAESLGNQNFLVIRAGDGTTAFNCPDDDVSTPLIQTTTWHHQPSS